MSERRKAEVARLRQRYGTVDHDPGYGWVIVRDLPLPAGWSRPKTDVLLVLQAGYPETAPDNFYVNPGLRVGTDAVPQNFTASGFNHEGTAWDLFSWHPDAGWSPAPRIEEGSNLLDVMREVERRLREVN